MLPDLVKLLLFALIQAAEGALLRINKWYELPMVAGQRAVLDFNLYLTCERFSLIFASDIDDLNRLTFLFDGEDLRKVDVDSPDYVTVPSPPPVIGGCRETDFKALQVNVSFREHTIEVQIGRQVAIRPKSNTSEIMRLLLPQKGACCLVSGALMLGNESLTESILFDSDGAFRLLIDIREANFSKQPFTPTASTPSYNTKHRALLVDMRIPPSTKPTRAPDVRQLSWTEMVNREWSVSFLVCSISVSVVMVVMVTLGISKRSRADIADEALDESAPAERQKATIHFHRGAALKAPPNRGRPPHKPDRPVPPYKLTRPLPSFKPASPRPLPPHHPGSPGPIPPQKPSSSNPVPSQKPDPLHSNKPPPVPSSSEETTKRVPTPTVPREETAVSGTVPSPEVTQKTDSATPTSKKPPEGPYKPVIVGRERQPIHTVPPPPDIWKKLEIGREVRRYWELEWSKSTFSKECSEHVLQVVPLYFWPGERLDLPCHMCELSMAYNGKVKYWAKAEKLEEFLTEPQINVLSRKDLYSIVQDNIHSTAPGGTEFKPFNMVHIPGNPEGTPPTMPTPMFYQRNGKLSIIHANPSNQGVYFCYDELSIGITNLFYVVQAMTPPVSIFDSDRIPEEEMHLFDDFCSTKDGSVQISPAINWRFHFQPTFRDDKPEHCTKGTVCEDYQEMTGSMWRSDNETCTLDGCRVSIPPIQMQNSQFDPGLDIELRWEDWSSCDGNVPAQRREAHCYIVTQPGFTVDEDAEELASGILEFEWAVKLGQLLRSEGMRNYGVRLHSSTVAAYLYRQTVLQGCGTVEEGVRIAVDSPTILRLFQESSSFSSTVAAYLYRQTVLQGCGTVEEGVRIAADDVWRKYLLRTMGVKDENGKQIERNYESPFNLENAFQACLRYQKTGENHEMIIGTYMVETRDCF
ncbi:unnamed protein product [Haemonchus placei]|uniref:Uncharacterized protein n=1 Tax=Haemonchus placei TaxID=6290 RepID=A0A0N4W233_HAEPC|nr:unnamed protein product [Haemonchus placei]